MLKTLVTSVATVSLIGTPAIAIAAAAPAGATTTALSPVGKYTATITFGTTSFPSPLTIKANGKFAFAGGGPHGTWTESAANVLSMTGTVKKETYAFVISQLSKKKLGSAAHQGTFSLGTVQIGTWYAVRG
jgi:hypothetical protein